MSARENGIRQRLNHKTPLKNRVDWWVDEGVLKIVEIIRKCGDTEI